jgi:molybdopterin molybdotransferase
LFFKVKTSEEVFEILRDFGPSGEENLSIEDSIGRILSRQITAPDDLPGYYKSTMDGYAVKAKDTFGASESIPALLELIGEVTMGVPPDFVLGHGQAVKISTGGMLPVGADGVVMVEYSSSLDQKTIEISKAISPLENIIRPDDDFKKGAVALNKGRRLRPQDLGLMAGLGISNAWAYKRPRVAIISTGDEIIPIDQKPEPAQVRDINSYTLSAFCRQAGVEPVVLGLCEDKFESLKDRFEQGLAEADTVWISGGSSVGTRDMTLKVLETFKDMELLVHGISISPGKPTIIARIGKKAIFGLPGHTASAMVVAEVFLTEFLSRISGKEYIDEVVNQEIEAELSRNIESVSGRDDYIRVKLIREGEKILAEPIFGKSGLISTLVEANGLLKVDRNT